MEIVISSKNLEEILNYISKVLPSKSTMEILSGILIEQKENELKFITTDLENTIIVSTENKNGNDLILIPGKQFISLIKQIPEQEIRITKIENEVEISNEGLKYTFITMNPEDFPKISKISPKISFNIQGNILKQAIEEIQFCVEPNESRPHFRGGLIDIRENNINFVGTDGRRLSIKTIQLKEDISPIKILISFKLMNILIDLLKDEEVNISIGKSQISFKFSNILLVSQLLAGVEDFPEYEKVVPDEKKCKIATIEKNTFLTSLKRISLFTNERYNKLKITLNDSVIDISVICPEIGRGQEKFEIDYKGEEISFAFPPEFLINFLQRVEDEKIIFAFTGKDRPVLLRPQNDINFIYISMPLKIE